MSACSPASATVHDVLIVGGGLVGGALACALGQAGLRVAVVDHEDPARLVRPEYDGRASAVALTARNALAAVGVWTGVAPHAQPILDIRVTEGDSPLFLQYGAEVRDDRPFGWMAENRVLRRALLARMAALPSVTLYAPARLAELSRDTDRAHAWLDDGRTLAAALVVAADGRNSAVRRQAGIGVVDWDYGQHGIVCTVGHERPHRGIAHERFLPAGPFAILPLPGNRSSIVWAERADLAPAILAQDDEGFLAELRLRFGDFLGDLALDGPRFSHPLGLRLALRYVDRRLALVGDAAHGLHPIAGQGMNMGIRDVAALAELVVERHRLGLDIGDPAVLARYQAWRRFDNLLMAAMTDGINRLFSNRIPPLRLVRDLGLAAVHRMPPLKRLFARHAMGLAGDLPRLLRGEAP
ncbi:MAG: UbiH/UbiF/VisC/COQ6 family ubiquinone biosynthesis hydroxylase [Rhodospirillales bacterium]|nr:UbiH/UbiF/VisC/COQ6 family ubiquinone biosynthesis hydroxylase [Rhodospirillales bacterium]